MKEPQPRKVPLGRYIDPLPSQIRSSGRRLEFLMGYLWNLVGNRRFLIDLLEIRKDFAFNIVPGVFSLGCMMP